MKKSADSLSQEKISSATRSQILLDKRRHKNGNSAQNHLNQNLEQFPSRADRLKEFNCDSFFWRPNTANLNESINQKVYLNGPGPGKYGRPSSIGCFNHDVTLPQRPAYTIGKAERATEFKGDVFYWRPGTGETAVRVGSHGSLHQNGPGPGKYSRPTSIGCLNRDVTLNRTPAYSIGRTERALNFNASPFYARPKTPGIFSTGPAVTPGPNAYPYEKYQSSYKSSVPSYSIGRARRFPTIIV